MCVKEYVGYNCGHCSIPTLRRCPLSTSNPTFPVCNWPAERAIHQQDFCHPCSRVIWNARILAEEEKHRQKHLDEECSCGLIFPGEDIEKRGRSREPQECAVQRSQYIGSESGLDVPLLQSPLVMASTFPTTVPTSTAGPIGIGYSYVPAIAPSTIPGLPVASIRYSQAPRYTSDLEQLDGGAFHYFTYNVEQGNRTPGVDPVSTPGFVYNSENPLGMKWYPDTTNLDPPSMPFARQDQVSHNPHVPRKGYKTHRNKHRGSKSSEPEVRGSRSIIPIGTRSSSAEPDRDAYNQSAEFESREPVIVTSDMEDSN